MMCHTMLVALVVLCASVQNVWGQGADRQSAQMAELSRASTSFGVSLYRELAKRADNVIFSPLSVYTALSMTLLGTQGATQQELQSVLALSSPDQVHSALQTVLTSLPTSPDSNVTLRLADGLYYDDAQITLAQNFSQALLSYYDNDPKPFKRPEPETAINDWVKDRTGGEIQNFLSPGAITADTVIMLLNAVYFQGTWKDIFDQRETGDSDFTTASGATVRVPMMYRDGAYSVKAIGHGIAARVVELPYGSDDRFSMFVLLPELVDGLADLEAGLTPQVLEEALTNMPHAYRVMLRMPKFSLRLKTSMKEMLQAMGLTTLFNNADLSSMVQQPSRPLAVSDVNHEAVIEVNEHGTKAVAVTSVGFVFLSLPPQININRPFLVVLRDKAQGLNLFMGRVTDPTQQEAHFHAIG